MSMLLKDKFDIFFDEQNNVYQIRTKNDVIIVEFSDLEKESLFNKILKLYNEKEFYTFIQLKSKLVKDYPYDKILDVIQELLECDLLNADNFEVDDEIVPLSPQQISFMNPNKSFSDLSEIKLGIIGEKAFGEIIKEKALIYGYSLINLLYFNDNLEEQDIRNMFEANDFVIVDTSLWNPYYMDLINETALKLNRPWLLVEGLVDMINYSIGPIFHGQETGCYECYKNRLRSNDEFLVYTQSYESYLKKGKKSSKCDTVPKLVKDLAADIIIMDISKFIGSWYIPETWRTCLMVNTQNFTVTKHYFLKAPICQVCNPILDYNPHPWLESVTLK